MLMIPDAFYEEVMAYYTDNGLSVKDFRCPEFEKCEKHAKDGVIIRSKEPYIGKKYAEGSIPKLLFLSLDPGKENVEIEKRTMKYVSDYVPVEWYVGEKNPCIRSHWYRTHEFAFDVFKCLNETHPALFNFEIGTLDDGRKDNRQPTIGSYFAHTNSAKCCLNLKDSAEADEPLFKNCKAHVIGELGVLKPDILVTQGNRAREVIEAAIKQGKYTRCQYTEQNISKSGSKNDYCILQADGRKIIWIHHNHPTSARWGGGFKKNHEHYGDYAKQIAKDLPDICPNFF